MRRFAHQGCLLVLVVIGFASIAAGDNIRGRDVMPLAPDSVNLNKRQLMQGGTGGAGAPGGDSNGPGNGGPGGPGGKGGDSFDGGPGGNGGDGGYGGSSFGEGDGGNGGKGGDGGNSGNSLFPKLSCKFGEYVLDNKCTACVSNLPTASTEVLRGVKCGKPFGVNNPNACSFGFLSGLQVQKTKIPLKVGTCLDYTQASVTVFVPRKSFRFFGAVTIGYVYNSISIAGAPLLPGAGIPLSNTYPAVVNGVQVDALVFTGTSAALTKAKGQGVAINGVVKVAGGFDLCFAATTEVCP